MTDLDASAPVLGDRVGDPATRAPAGDPAEAAAPGAGVVQAPAVRAPAGEPVAGGPVRAGRGWRWTRRARLAAGLAATAALAAVTLVGLLSSRSGLDGARVGSCVRGWSGNDLRVVDCGRGYDWRVVGRVEGRTEAAFNADTDLTICSGAPGTEAQFWRGGRGETGYVLCLAPASQPAH